jgi:quinolinate synthase
MLLARTDNPDAVIMVHPECPKEIRDLSDFVVGTGGMLRIAQTSQASHFLIGTEEGMVYRLQKEVPTKNFTLINRRLYCPNMKKTTLESVKRALQEKQESIVIPELYQEKALISIERMLAIK